MNHPPATSQRPAHHDGEPYACTACPSGYAQHENHCTGCGQHLTLAPVPTEPTYTGVQCRSECEHHPLGRHQPGTPTDGANADIYPCG